VGVPVVIDERGEWMDGWDGSKMMIVWFNDQACCLVMNK
jgi:hypothetical protein